MNSHEPSEAPPVPPRIPQVDPAGPKKNPNRWLHYLLAGNPFYIISAVLLLFSIRKLSLDSRIFPEEAPQLLFNFSSFQIYELMLAGTAIFLARRRIWYDSGLLVALENLFLFVPFILISQASMIKGPMALTVCVGGCLLVALRGGALQRWLPTFKMPLGLMLVGVGLLCVNFVLPIEVQRLHRVSDSEMWSTRGPLLQSLEWFLVAPLAVLMANFVALPRHRSDTTNEAFFTKRYFALTMLVFWLAGTGAHFYCIDYVHLLPWSVALLVPAFWIGSWTIYRLSQRIVLPFPQYERLVRKVLFTLPITVLGLAATEKDLGMVFGFTAVNALIYLTVAARKRDGYAVKLFLASISFFMASVPMDWIRPLHLGITRPEIMVGSFLSCVLFVTLLSRDPRAGIVGALATVMLVSGVPGGFETMINLGLQAGAVFLLLHSLRWSGREKGEGTMRIMTAIFWFGHAYQWVTQDSEVAREGVFGAAVGLLLVYFLARLVFRKWGPMIIPSAGLAVALVPIGCDSLTWIRHAPLGLLIMIGSFGLFVLGTVAALLKGKWIHQEQIPAPVVQNREVL